MMQNANERAECANPHCGNPGDVEFRCATGLVLICRSCMAQIEYNARLYSRKGGD